MKDTIERVRKYAQDALNAYARETVGGSNPSYPQIATDILDVCELAEWAEGMKAVLSTSTITINP